MSTICTFGHIENKHSLHCGEDYMKKFCESLREHAKDIIDFEEDKLLALTQKELKSCHSCRKKFIKKFAKAKNYQKFRDHCYYTGRYRVTTYSICNLRFNVFNNIPVVFHIGSN